MLREITQEIRIEINWVESRSAEKFQKGVCMQMGEKQDKESRKLKIIYSKMHTAETAVLDLKTACWDSNVLLGLIW